jgi:phage-related protein
MPQALPLTTYISLSSTRTRMNRMLSTQFGDGYSQEAPDGTNALYDTWTITYENLSLTDRNTLFAVLDAVGGWDYLTWTAPGDGTSKKWKVTKDGVQEQPQTGGVYNVSFKVKQVF